MRICEVCGEPATLHVTIANEKKDMKSVCSQECATRIGPIIYFEGQADGALPNGTRIAKCDSEPGDTHKDGETGKVTGSIGPVELPSIGGEEGYIYFVQWDNSNPPQPAAVVSHRIKKADE